MKKLLSITFVFVLLLSMLSSCDSTDTHTTTGGSNTISAGESTENTTSAPAEVNLPRTNADMFTDRDYEVGYDESKCVLIQLNGNAATASSNSVNISGTTVTITEEATYIISGSLDDGMIIVNADDAAKLQIVLRNASIHSETSAALYIRSADKVFVTLADETENTLSNGGTFTAIDESNIDAALFSKEDLTLNGLGSLTVTSPAGHGIVCKDDLVLTSGTYTVNTASHGFDVNDSVRITNASITIDAGKDGIHAENDDDASLGFVYASSGTVTIEAEGDGISAGAYMQFEGGSFDIVAGGGSENGTKSASGNYGGFMGGHSGMGGRGSMPPSSIDSIAATDEASTSMKGIKAAGSILFTYGTFTINSADDAIHTNTSLTINGGTFQIASGDDAVHADDTLTVTACTMNITESYEGLEALHIAISGGNIKLVASDDGLNAAGGTDSSGITGGRDGMFMGGGMGGGMSSSSNGSIVISGGTLYINSSGDGLDANGTLAISGGHTTVVGPTSGDTATLDYDVSGSITGGTFIGTGASMMAQTFSDSEQGVFAVQVGNQPAGTTITLTDSDGNAVITHTPELSFQIFIFSSPDIISGQTYTITVGGVSGDFEAS